MISQGKEAAALTKEMPPQPAKFAETGKKRPAIFAGALLLAARAMQKSLGKAGRRA
jgi:hypothetical protein